jgi:pyridoxal phosphate enzyme (YggS family)
MSELRENLASIEEAIVAACQGAGRKRDEIELMAVSKTYPAPVLVEAVQLGLTLFGENRVQEWQGKAEEFAALKTRATRTHLIGHLQSNKAARAVELFDGIDSIDSLKLAERVNEVAGKLGKRLPVLIEVKLSTEETKAGLDPESAEASALLERLGTMENLIPQGLMTIAPFGVPEAETRACFRALREWRERWAGLHPELGWNVLSMGMSGDFRIAIEEGATRIRIGTAIFGKRSKAVGASLDAAEGEL